MPTIYSDCIDCVDLSHLAHLISNETHEKNVVLFKELQKGLITQNYQEN